MTEIEFSSEMTVKLVRSMAGDDMVVQAAQVSAKGENNPETVPLRLIQALMKGKHGSPFEHNAFTFFVEAPLFVFREWQRHRIGSFNEMSGRYTELPGKFYVPGKDRNVYNSGTKMKPDFTQTEWDIDANREDTLNKSAVSESLRTVSSNAWFHYQDLLYRGVANEVARMVLPLNIYSQMYWTVNARSLMNFLSLRGTQDDRPEEIRSYPQREIQMAAEEIEVLFDTAMPHTYHAFVENGRVAP